MARGRRERRRSSAQGEIGGIVEGFIDAAFGEAPPAGAPAAGGVALAKRVLRLRGGFPEAVSIGSSNRRAAWFDAYLTTILGRDVRDLANIERVTELPRLLALVAARPGALLNYAELGRSAGLAQSTLKRYFALLEAVFLVRTLRPWHANIGKRMVKMPKVLVCDSGLAAHVMGIDDTRLAQDRTIFGGLLEGFVAMELTKQIGWSSAAPTSRACARSPKRRAAVFIAASCCIRARTGVRGVPEGRLNGDARRPAGPARPAGRGVRPRQPRKPRPGTGLAWLARSDRARRPWAARSTHVLEAVMHRRTPFAPFARCGPIRRRIYEM